MLHAALSAVDDPTFGLGARPHRSLMLMDVVTSPCSGVVAKNAALAWAPVEAAWEAEFGRLAA